MTAGTAVGRVVTIGHPPQYTTLRNAKSAEWLLADREGRRRLPPKYCGQCSGWHLTEPTPDSP